MVSTARGYGALRAGESLIRRILVTGAGGPAGCAVRELLLQRGHRVIAADMLPSPADGIERVPPASDPDFVSGLERLARRSLCDLVIPTVSEELPILADQWDRDAIPIMLASSGSVRIADDKFAFCEHLRFRGVAVPGYRLPSWKSDGMGWPLLSKSRIGRGGRDVVAHESEKTLQGLDDGYILQEFIPSTEYAPNIYYDDRSTCIVLKKTKLKQGIVGNASAVLRVNEPEIAELALAAAEAIGLFGPIDMDIRRR